MLFHDYFLSDTKCGLTTSRTQRYLGIVCDSNATPFRVPLLESSSGGGRPRRSGYHFEGSAGVIFFFFFAKTWPLRREGTHYLLDTVSLSQSRWNTLYNT